jgi:hypothetical protein
MSELSKEEGETVSLPDGRNLGYLVVGEARASVSATKP